MLDGSGFVHRCEVFAGAVNEDATLARMLDALQAPSAALVVMDAGVATEANVAWLRDNGYRYLVVSRERTRCFDPDLAVAKERCFPGSTLLGHVGVSFRGRWGHPKSAHLRTPQRACARC